MITGINHITFSVSNLEKSIIFYTEVLGLMLVGKWDRGAYLLAGKMWIALNVYDKGTIVPNNSYSHIAFDVEQGEFYEICKSLRDWGGAETYKENTSEGDSFYFYDPDRNKLELHYNTLDDRLMWMKHHNIEFQSK